MSRIISYRGLLADGAQDTIPLHTNDGKTGYKVVKFQIMFSNPGAASAEHVVKMYKIEQTTIDGLIDFSDLTLLGAGYIKERGGDYYGHGIGPIIFDNEVFNQDIYVTASAITAGGDCNYYIELEQIDLTEDQALVAIVKNLRNEQ